MVRATGLGSGLDVEGLVSQLLSAEANPQTLRLNKSETAFQAKISAYGTLRGALTEFKNALSGLKDLTALSARKVTLSDDTHLAATASDEAVPGTYDIEVRSLARPQRLMSAGFATPATTVGTGTLTFTSGSDSFAVTVGTANQTLEGIRDAINSATGNDSVDATIITVDNGTGGQISRLVLGARNPGTTNGITVAVTGDADASNTDNAGLSRLSYATGAQNLTVQQTATDAVVRIYGQDVTRSTNSIDDAIDGVTLDLKEAEIGVTTTVTVALDTAKLKDSINGFVKSYNALTANLRNLSKYDAATGSKGALIGDSTLRAVDSRLRRLIGDSADIDGRYKTLASIGIKVDDSGVLSADSTTLETALSTSFSDVAALFGTEEEGLGARLDAMLSGYTEGKGIIQARVDGLQAGLKDVAEQRRALETRITGLEARYRAQFNALDQVVAQLSSTSNFLSGQLATLPGFVK